MSGELIDRIAELNLQKSRLEYDLRVTQEKLDRAIKLLQQTSKKLHAVSEATVDIFFHAANHNLPYTGPQYGKELKAIDKLLADWGIEDEQE